MRDGVSRGGLVFWALVLGSLTESCGGIDVDGLFWGSVREEPVFCAYCLVGQMSLEKDTYSQLQRARYHSGLS